MVTTKNVDIVVRMLDEMHAIYVSAIFLARRYPC